VFTWWFPVQALWLMLPAYVANMAPVFLVKLFPRWNRPIDGGRVHRDGTRLLGDGKTWRGLIGGSIVAALFAMLQAHVLRFWDGLTDFGVTESGHFWAPLLIGFAFGLGALVGDAVKSYLKRRSGRPRGAPWVGPDQLDFVFGGLLFAAVVGLALGGAPDWTREWLVSHWWIPLFLVLATPLLHWLVNILGHALTLKQEPW
jgi:CDP-2,3-bis-(O-geranylgeranyl)-sn-glycerol synthase